MNNTNEKKDIVFVNNNNDCIEKLDLNSEIDNFSELLEKNKKDLAKKIKKIKIKK